MRWPANLKASRQLLRIAGDRDGMEFA